MSDEKESVIFVGEEDFAKDHKKWLRLASPMCRVMVGNERDGYSLVAGGGLGDGDDELDSEHRQGLEAEIDVLRAQLADAKAVIEAARRVQNAYLTISHGECLREMYVALKNYEAKHGAK